MKRLCALAAALLISAAPYIATTATVTTVVAVAGCAANAHTQVAQGRDVLTRVERQLRMANERGILSDEAYVATRPAQEMAQAALVSAKEQADEPDSFMRWMLIFDGALAQLEQSLIESGGGP